MSEDDDLKAARLAMQSHQRHIEEISRLGQPILAALKAIEDQSGQINSAYSLMLANSGTERLLDAARSIYDNQALREITDTLKRHEEISRMAFGPLSDLSRAGLLDAPWQGDMELARQSLTAFEERFSLPAIGEIPELSIPYYDTSLAKMFEVSLQQENTVRQAMGQMNTPWLDAHGMSKSVAGFAELQGIGVALRSLPSFDDDLAAGLRRSLGDWRDEMTLPADIFTDLKARSEFYVGLGFNPALTDFPLPAFEQGLSLAGLKPAIVPPVSENKAAQPGSDLDEEAFARTNTAQGRLLKLERLLRKFIDERMTQSFGADWPERRLPNGLYERWREKKEKAERAGAEERALIEYIDFTDYVLLICKKENWQDAFEAVFGRTESVRESFQRLYPIRLDTAHGRLITQDDELFLVVEVKRLENAVKRHRK